MIIALIILLALEMYYLSNYFIVVYNLLFKLFHLALHNFINELRYEYYERRIQRLYL